MSTPLKSGSQLREALALPAVDSQGGIISIWLTLIGPHKNLEGGI